MNSVMRVIVVVLMSCTSLFLYSAADKPDKPLSATEWLFRHMVLNEPRAEHANPCAWIIDSTKTASAIACVDKEWNALHKKYIADPRKKLMQAHQQNFDAVHLSSLLCDKYAHYCCLVSKDKKIKALFGVAGSEPSVFTIRPGQNDKPKPEHISSTTITYYDKQQKKIEAPAFQFILNTKMPHHQIGIILPEEKQRYTLYLQPKFYGLTACTSTLNKIIAVTFELSENPNFWDYHFSKNGVTVEREGNIANISINLKDPYFEKACANSFTLYAIAKKFAEDQCSCGTNHIDPTCKDNYETVCKILEEEKATHLKPFFITFFYHQHLLHNIGYIDAGNHTKTIYINPAGTIFTYTPHNNRLLHTPFHDLDNVRSNLNLDSLPVAAAAHASNWRIMGNLLLQNGTQKITYFSYDASNDRFSPKNNLMLKNNEAVIDGMTLWYDNSKIIFNVTIFVLQTASKRTKLLFGDDSVKVYDSEAKEQNILKRGLARMLYEKNARSYALTPPEQEIVTFMHFIKGIENPIKNIEKICPNFDYANSRDYPFHF